MLDYLPQLQFVSRSWGIGIIFVVLIVLLTLGNRRTVSARALVLFRVLFPSWRFFEDVTAIPHLLIRVSGSDGELGEWTEATVSTKRTPWMFIYNPQGNLALAIGSLLQQVESDIGDLNQRDVEHFEKSTSFKLLCSLVAYHVQGSQQPAPSSKLQFKLLRVTQGEPLSTGEEFLISRVYTWESLEACG